ESRPVLLAASMREGEEELLLDALHGLDVASLLLVIVPRHPQRFEEVAALLKRRGIAFQRRSENREIVPDTRIILGDSMGEMFAYYAACDLAFIGGSLLPYGAQNLIEACAVGKPVIIGPSVYNFAEATRLAVEQGAAIQVRDARELAREAARVLRDNALSEKMSQAALAFSRMHQGATERIMALLRF
ncbi:MAG: glycosyltransferase, partial [Betaproteobacteria bacterium]|nr:glycosyltransferase [Betaproteobacteria bacterium]